MNDFDVNGDINFGHGSLSTRGGMPYHQPSRPWERKGLKVVDKYDNRNVDWLAMNGNQNEWAVAFHGFRNPEYVIPKIIIEGLRPGSR